MENKELKDNIMKEEIKNLTNLQYMYGNTKVFDTEKVLEKELGKKIMQNVYYNDVIEYDKDNKPYTRTVIRP